MSMIVFILGDNCINSRDYISAVVEDFSASSRSLGSFQSYQSNTWHILFLPHFCQRSLPFYSKLNWSAHAYTSVAQAGVFVLLLLFEQKFLAKINWQLG